MVNTNARRVLTVSVGAALMLATSFLGACAFKPGGSGSSNDTFTYQSFAHAPQTISVVDTRTGQPVWTGEVPVGQQLVVRFVDRTGESESENNALMRWAYMPINSQQVSLPNTVTVPPASARRIDMELREGPEGHMSSAGGN